MILSENFNFLHLAFQAIVCKIFLAQSLRPCLEAKIILMSCTQAGIKEHRRFPPKPPSIWVSPLKAQVVAKKAGRGGGSFNFYFSPYMISPLFIYFLFIISSLRSPAATVKIGCYNIELK